MCLSALGLSRASKCALNIVSKSLSIDLKERNVDTILLHPGWVRTDMTSGNGLIDDSAFAPHPHHPGCRRLSPHPRNVTYRSSQVPSFAPSDLALTRCPLACLPVCVCVCVCVCGCSHVCEGHDLCAGGPARAEREVV